ncbi:response regulator [Sulfurimonas sp. HSL3-2]|uniref:response regulator n=1 Tax=Hydrocurvibacter mobilis TaxID=3131936 RepID=UPI0031F8234A
MNIAILENDINTASFLEETVKQLGHNVIGSFYNANDLIKAINKNYIDLFLLDINIEATIDGIDCARQIYTHNKDIKIVFLTAYKDTRIITQASVVSPIGYLIKPIDKFDIEAILMVVDTNINTPIPANSKQILLKQGCIFDLEKSIINSNGKIITLTKNEIKCLCSLIKNKNSCISAEQLMLNIWGNTDERISSLRELIFRLRKKIPDLPLNNIPRVGYILLNTMF